MRRCNERTPSSLLPPSDQQPLLESLKSSECRHASSAPLLEGRCGSRGCLPTRKTSLNHESSRSVDHSEGTAYAVPPFRSDSPSSDAVSYLLPLPPYQNLNCLPSSSTLASIALLERRTHDGRVRLIARNLCETLRISACGGGCRNRLPPCSTVQHRMNQITLCSCRMPIDNGKTSLAVIRHGRCGWGRRRAQCDATPIDAHADENPSHNVFLAACTSR